MPSSYSAACMYTFVYICMCAFFLLSHLPQAPVSMKAVCQAAWLWTVAFGNLIVIIIAESSIFANQVSNDYCGLRSAMIIVVITCRVVLYTCALCLICIHTCKESFKDYILVQWYVWQLIQNNYM